MNLIPFIRPRRLGKVNVPTVTLAHGGGGKAMKDLIDDVFVEAFNNAALAPLEDQARFDLAAIAAHGDRLAFTTDAFVVDPLIFPGGDIGKLAVCGTVNDLTVGGARPLYLSCAVIIEEGVTIELLRQIARCSTMATPICSGGALLRSSIVGNRSKKRTVISSREGRLSSRHDHIAEVDRTVDLTQGLRKARSRQGADLARRGRIGFRSEATSAI
jgi:hypothetical protein